jgi:hypothetical protein
VRSFSLLPRRSKTVRTDWPCSRRSGTDSARYREVEHRGTAPTPSRAVAGHLYEPGHRSQRQKRLSSAVHRETPILEVIVTSDGGVCYASVCAPMRADLFAARAANLLSRAPAGLDARCRTEGRVKDAPSDLGVLVPACLSLGSDQRDALSAVMAAFERSPVRLDRSLPNACGSISNAPKRSAPGRTSCPRSRSQPCQAQQRRRFRSVRHAVRRAA